MGRFTRSVCCCLFLAGVFGSAPAEAGKVVISAAGGYFSVPVTSLKEARFKTVIKQKFDYSCGSAAVATLLTYHYARPTTEEEVFKAMFVAADEEKVREFGFSLLDMRKYLESQQGLRADGFEVPLERLLRVNVPAITLITTKGYKHFVLIKGLGDDEVLVGDPALGMKVYRREKFEEMWNGVIFVIRDEIDVARGHFNDEKEWGVRAKAPFGTALSREGLAMFTMTLPGRNEF